LIITQRCCICGGGPGLLPGAEIQAGEFIPVGLLSQEISAAIQVIDDGEELLSPACFRRLL
jgi:hypothetical protein